MTKTRVLVVAVVLAVFTGCSASPTSTFHGKVDVGGRPVTSGVIYFLGPAPDMRMGMGTIHDDGTYTATDVPVGEVRVSFQAPGVPQWYADPNTSSLVYTITPRMTSLDISVPADR
ncbi:MAG TPA: hypothetical protein VM597_04540 [Gemmataceae bacterium]|jgi:hypothetical protein|nr:hypothetical protein [Gemmataceae bacterium]